MIQHDIDFTTFFDHRSPACVAEKAVSVEQTRAINPFLSKSGYCRVKALALRSVGRLPVRPAVDF